MSRTLCIGDVHGCYDELMALLDKLQLQKEDMLYFVGDLINKGPKSLEVVDFVRSRPNTFSVIGNHEFFSLSQKYTDHGQGNQDWIDIQYEKTAPIRTLLKEKGHIEWLLSLPTMIEREDFMIVHAGIDPRYGRETPLEIATIIRMYEGKPWYEYYTGTKKIIYGHWAVEGLRIRKNTIGLDTGCCFGGHLTAYCIETGEIWQMRANGVYKEPANWKTR